jgi:CubicO group peptidase (beta-lactamase class C family)
MDQARVAVRAAVFVGMLSMAVGRVVAADVPALTAAQVAAVDKFMAAEIVREKVPGVAVGIYSRGKILLAKGYGLSNVELAVPVKPETIFQSGSVGKQFTAAGIMMLVEEGKVGLDDSITKYFPNAPKWWEPIKVKNLLSHTSGLSEYETAERSGPKGPFYMRLDYTEDEMVDKLKALPMEFAPGEKWDYRNTNYVLLGVIIHRVTGKFYADYLHERVFAPLGMDATRLISEADIVPNRSAGYELDGDTLKNQSWVSPTFNSTADGALYFNVLDLAKWDGALYGTKLLKQSSLDAWWTIFVLNDRKPNSANYGFAWAIDSLNGHKMIEHGGAWQGFKTHIARYVDDSMTVVVLANLEEANPTHMAHVIAGLVNPALEPPKLAVIEDKQPETAKRMSELIDRIMAGNDVRGQFTSELAAEWTPQLAATFKSRAKTVWPADNVTLVKRTVEDGETESNYRVVKGKESRIALFGEKDGKVSLVWVGLDPDVR